MNKRVLIIPFMMSVILSCHGQKLSTKESSELQTTIHSFFSKSPVTISMGNKNSNKPEIFLCILRVGDNGKISSLNLLSDASNVDSGYAVLSKLRVVNFEKWKSDSAKDKTIIIPISVFGNVEPVHYVGSFLSDFYKLGNQSKNMINVAGVNLYWPQTKRSTN